MPRNTTDLFSKSIVCLQGTVYGCDTEASVIVRLALFEQEVIGRTHSAGKGFLHYLFFVRIFELMNDCSLSTATGARRVNVTRIFHVSSKNIL